MRQVARMLVSGVLLGCASAVVTAPSAAQAPASALPCERLGEILGSDGAANGAICRVNLPRGDLEVTLLGADLPTGMGMTSWAAFQQTGENGSVVMGDLALTPEELPAVMLGLREGGVTVTAVHRHMLGESPPVVFMHYMGVGEAEQLAAALAAALDRAPDARGRLATGRQSGEPGQVAGTSCARLEEILGVSAGSADQGPGYCKISIPRPANEVSIDGLPIPPALGIGSWFAFRETRDGDAAVIAGDMALRQTQVNPAIGALRENGVAVVALHNHMLFEEPRIVFFHFQARGQPEALAHALRAGIDAAADARRSSGAGPRP